MLRFVVFLLLTTTYGAAQFTASFSPQPVETFRAAFGSRLKGVAVFDVTVCSNAPQDAVVAAGRVIQAAQTQISTVNRSLAQAAIGKARRGNAKYRAARILEWASWIAGFFTASGTISASPEIAAIFPILAGAGHRLADEFEGQVPDAGAWSKDWLEDAITLAPGACATRLLLGGYKPGLKSFSVEVK
jgi:hypothetical protein